MLGVAFGSLQKWFFPLMAHDLGPSYQMLTANRLQDGDVLTAKSAAAGCYV